MKILVFDNYDSFTYNLVHMIEHITHTKVDVFRNDKIALEKVNDYDKIILSPGPGVPCDAGILMDIIVEYAPTKSILGVCLGHQAIGQVFGATLKNLDNVFHGVATFCKQNGKSDLFSSLPENIEVGRYHSWIVSEEAFPEDLEVTAYDENNYIMGLRHRTYDVEGVQFHPESVLTPDGKTIINNWLKR